MNNEAIIQALRTLKFQNEDIINYMLIMHNLELTNSKLNLIIRERMKMKAMKETTAVKILNLETEYYMPRNLRLYGNVYIGKLKDGEKIRKELHQFGLDTTFNKEKFILELV